MRGTCSFVVGRFSSLFCRKGTLAGDLCSLEEVMSCKVTDNGRNAGRTSSTLPLGGWQPICEFNLSFSLSLLGFESLVTQLSAGFFEALRLFFTKELKSINTCFFLEEI